MTARGAAMAISEQPPKKKKPQRSSDDINLLKSEVASFVSSLGLAPSVPGGGGGGGGFDDSDFRKSGPLKTPRTPKSLNPPNSSDFDASKPKDKKPPPDLKSKAKSHPLQIDPFSSSQKPSLKGKDKLPLMKASSLSGQWYTDAEALESKVLGSEGGKPPILGVEAMKGLAERKKEVAERLMEQYSSDYESSRRKSGDMRLLETTARSGTSADKVSAFTCLVEDNPIANVRSFDALLAMVTSKVGKRYAFTGFDALKELFMLRLLPDRKLKCLTQRPLDKLPETKDGFSLLLFWYWEEFLKQRYERFIIALEDALKDMLPNLKDKAMKTVYILLKSKSEQERRLLSALVNKLGDPERKAASSAGYHLSCLLSAHPNMKAVVIDEVDSFLFRPHIGLRAKYQAVNFLSQILLSKRGDGPKIAKRLIDVYFALFKVLISENDGVKMRRKNERSDKKKATNSLRNSKKEHSVESHVEMDSRLLSALLVGVNRAFPFVSSDEADDIIEVQTPILFRLVHSENFNVGVQALMLLYQISSKNHITSDRFYRALYSKLLSPAAVNSSKPELFLGLLVKAMKNDINLKRISAFSKRLLQVALHRPPQYACGCLFILSEVLKAKPPLWMIVLQKESGDDEIEHFEDIREDNEDMNIQPSTISASSGNVAAQSGKKLLTADQEKDCNILSSKAADDDDPGQVQTPHMQSSLPGGYDPRHREPLYCNADHASWWELTILASHVHPSVATMARTLLSGINIVYNGDPLSDLSLNAFLDKFMEKKPKPNKIAEGRWHGGSQIAPAKKLDLNHHLIGDEILELAEEEVPPEDVVFHRFYMNKTSSSKKSKKPKMKKKVSDDEDAEELISDASDNESEEEEIDDMLGSGHLPLTEDKEGDYDYDDLDRVIDDDDDDLLGNGSDGETTDHPLTAQKHGEGSESDDNDDDEGSIDIWDDDATGNSDDGGSNDSSGDEGDKLEQTCSRKKRKSEGRSRPSPFASLEDYEHLLSNDDKGSGKKSKAQKKKRKTSS